jgi:hypothetical protein
MWSYPIIRDGLIYVIDVRNGLYVLRYTGPRQDEIANIDFLEGNSNLGDAVDLRQRLATARSKDRPGPAAVKPPAASSLQGAGCSDGVSTLRLGGEKEG